jgi:putative transposase
MAPSLAFHPTPTYTNTCRLHPFPIYPELSMRPLLQPLLLLFAGANHKDMARQIQYLREENRILRGKLPERIMVTAAECNRLIKYGKELGAGLKELISIVSYSTFRRWMRGPAPTRKQRPRGRPGKPLDLRKLVLHLALTTGWGYTRVLGQLRMLTSHKVSRQFVINVMRENGLDPGPKRGEKTWAEFIRVHAATLWQCDFFTKSVLTWTGWRDYFVFVCLHVGSRRVFVSPATANPTAEWTNQQAQAFVQHLQQRGMTDGAIVIRDNDSKYGTAFDATLDKAGVKVQRIPVRSPNMNAFVERWIGSIQRECLDHFVAIGETHLNLLVNEYVAHHHEERAHQGIGNIPLTGEPDAPEDIPTLKMIGCKKRLGGVLKLFYRKAG